MELGLFIGCQEATCSRMHRSWGMNGGWRLGFLLQSVGFVCVCCLENLQKNGTLILHNWMIDMQHPHEMQAVSSSCFLRIQNECGMSCNSQLCKVSSVQHQVVGQMNTLVLDLDILLAAAFPGQHWEKELSRKLSVDLQELVTSEFVEKDKQLISDRMLELVRRLTNSFVIWA